ncbi:MAG: hypothetical protein AAGF24_04655 [Cyanobacteria bacterium P01_H01_bin.121]
MQELFIQLITLGSVISLVAWVSWQFRKTNRINRVLTWLLLLLSLLILGVSLVRLGLNPSAVPRFVGLISGSLVLLGGILQLVIRSSAGQSKSGFTLENYNLLEHGLSWFRGTWAVFSLIVVPLLLWISLAQTWQTLGLWVGQGLFILIGGAIVWRVDTLFMPQTLKAPGSGFVILLLPLALGGILVAFNLLLGWFNLDSTLNHWLTPDDLDNLTWLLSAILLPPCMQVGAAIGLQTLSGQP